MVQDMNGCIGAGVNYYLIYTYISILYDEYEASILVLSAEIRIGMQRDSKAKRVYNI
jgi:hypothetical protein